MRVAGDRPESGADQPAMVRSRGLLESRVALAVPPLPSLYSALTLSPKSEELFFLLSWSVEQLSPCGQPQMVGSLAGYMVGGGANTLRGLILYTFG
jgi:hypothetical protein